MRSLYSGEVTMMDHWLGRFLDKMEGLSLFENTLLIAISDHGVAFGEHGIVGKIPSALWPEVTDIPFFVRHPEGKGAGQTSEYAMMGRNDGTEARLYDLREDPGMHNDIAGDEPGTVKRMFEDYVLADAGGPLPRY